MASTQWSTERHGSWESGSDVTGLPRGSGEIDGRRWSYVDPQFGGVVPDRSLVPCEPHGWVPDWRLMRATLAGRLAKKEMEGRQWDFPTRQYVLPPPAYWVVLRGASETTPAGVFRSNYDHQRSICDDEGCIAARAVHHAFSSAAEVKAYLYAALPHFHVAEFPWYSAQ